MKPTAVCVAVTLAVLWAGSITLAAKDANTPKPVLSPKASVEVKEAGKALSPRQRTLENAQRSHETELRPWKEVLKVAEEEKATKTIAAIKQIIADKEEAYKKTLAQIEKMNAAASNRPNMLPAPVKKNTDTATEKKPENK